MFVFRWSTMEDSILNLESVEARNRELVSSDASLKSQLSLLDAESTRLRSGNRELRARLAQLERQEARGSGHQNPAQKISYMQHLKEIILKHQQVSNNIYKSSMRN
jgi:regulator of replication initiation timing